MRHDNIRDFLAGLLDIVQNDVQIEPPLQHLHTEILQSQVGNTTDGARLDIRARSFWRQNQNAFFDVRVTNPLSATSMKTSLTTVYDRHEKEKKRNYNHRVMSVEHGTFTPVVFSVFGTAGPECNIFLKKLLSKISEKRGERYGDVANWVRCKLSFLCIKACLVCIRGTRTSQERYISEDFNMDNCEANLG